jgi:hypothetical protein
MSRTSLSLWLLGAGCSGKSDADPTGDTGASVPPYDCHAIRARDFDVDGTLEHEARRSSATSPTCTRGARPEPEALLTTRTYGGTCP